MSGKCQLKLKNWRSSDITNFTFILILYGLSCKNLLEYLKNVSWILVRLD